MVVTSENALKTQLVLCMGYVKSMFTLFSRFIKKGSMQYALISIFEFHHYGNMGQFEVQTLKQHHL